MRKKSHWRMKLLVLAVAGIGIIVLTTLHSSEPRATLLHSTTDIPVTSSPPPTATTNVAKNPETTASPTPLPTKEAVEVLSAASLDKLPATTILSKESLDASHMSQYFYQADISKDLYQRIYKKSYKEDCTIPLEDLSYLRVLHYGFDHEIHIGELMVNKSIADKVLAIFQELYDAKYPIEKMILIDDYDADDDASMEDNNSSCFNYRVIDGTTQLSKHSQGVAIDINPLYNPYVRPGNGQRTVLPENGAAYADRTLACPYYIDTSDICYQTFIKYGFTWGGEWIHSKDYQHFEISLP